MGGIIDWLSGASGSANAAAGKVGDYYNNAIDQSNSGYGSAGTGLQAAYANALPQIQSQYANALPGISAAYSGAQASSNAGYTDAEGKLIDATGSPAAAQFAALQAQGLQPAFDRQNAALPGQAAALGLTGSGAVSRMAGDLSAGQSSALASADAPLYANAESQYGNLLGQQAGANTSLAGQGAGAVSNELGAGANAAGNFIGQGTSAYGNLLGQQAGAASGIAGTGAGAQGSTYTNTYNQGIADFYSGLEAAGTAAAGAPGGGGGAPVTNTQYTSTPASNNAGLTGIYAPGASANATNAQGQLLSDPYYGAAPVAAPAAAVPQAQAPYNPYGSNQSAGSTPANYNPYAQAA